MKHITCVIFIPAAVNFDIKTLLKMFEDRSTPHIIISVVKEIELAVSPVQKNALLNIAHTSNHLEQNSNNILLHRILSFVVIRINNSEYLYNFRVQSFRSI